LQGFESNLEIQKGFKSTWANFAQRPARTGLLQPAAPDYAARLHSRVWPMTTPPALHAAHGHGRPGVADAHGARTRVDWCLANEPANRAGWPFASCKGDGWCGSGVSWTMWLSTGSRDGPDVASTLRSDLHKEGGKVGSMQPKREAGTGPRPAKVRRGHHQRHRGS
jgi:hypothetical protein